MPVLLLLGTSPAKVATRERLNENEMKNAEQSGEDEEAERIRVDDRKGVEKIEKEEKCSEAAERARPVNLEIRFIRTERSLSPSKNPPTLLPRVHRAAAMPHT